MDVDEILRTLDVLREYDPEYELFGAGKHRYELAEPLDEAQVAEFEARQGVRLPADYRTFVTHVGRGGAGPYYGLLPLSSESGGDGSLSRPFRFTEEWLPPEDDDEWDRATAPGCDVFDGLFLLAEQGCGYLSHLVVSGAAAGQVWGDYTCVGEALCPEAESFGSWYRDWLVVSLRTVLGNRIESTVADETGWEVDRRLLDLLPPPLPSGEEVDPGVRVLRLLSAAYLALYERRHDDVRELLSTAGAVGSAADHGAEIGLVEAVLLREEGKVADSMAAVEAAIERDCWATEETRLRRLQVELLLMRGSVDDAQAVNEEHVAKCSGDDFGYARRALFPVLAGDPDGAEETLRREAALGSRPGTLDTWIPPEERPVKALRRRARRLAWECRRWGHADDAERFEAIADDRAG